MKVAWEEMTIYRQCDGFTLLKLWETSKLEYQHAHTRFT